MSHQLIRVDPNKPLFKYCPKCKKVSGMIDIEEFSKCTECGNRKLVFYYPKCQCRVCKDSNTHSKDTK